MLTRITIRLCDRNGNKELIYDAFSSFFLLFPFFFLFFFSDFNTWIRQSFLVFLTCLEAPTKEQPAVILKTMLNNCTLISEIFAIRGERISRVMSRVTLSSIKAIKPRRYTCQIG